MTDTHQHTCPFGPGPAQRLCAADCPRADCSGKRAGQEAPVRVDDETQRFTLDRWVRAGGSP